MTQITAAWLEERGGLHDARVLAAEADATAVRVTIHNEWANEHQENDPPSVGTLVLSGAAIMEGNIPSIRGGWISEVAWDGDLLVLDFCDRDRLVARTSSAVWESARTS